MWNRSRNRIEGEKLDRFGAELMHAFEANEAEVNTAAASPFLFRRIRARIEAEQRRLAEESNPWVALFVQVRRAIPVFALLTVAALISSLYLHSVERGGKSQLSIDGGVAVEQQVTLVAGLPAFLQDAQDDVEASLVGWQGSQPGQRKE
jgi:hypothetical protein